MGNGSSTPAAPIDTGNYIGYTQGGGPGQKPTLYFENGRLTQEHDHSDNEGWHPLKPGTHYMANVGPHDAIEVIAPVGVTSDMMEPVIDDYKRKKGISDTKGPFLLEYNTLGGKVTRTHRSRGKFIRPGDPIFNPSFDDSYAYGQATAAQLAANEK